MSQPEQPWIGLCCRAHNCGGQIFDLAQATDHSPVRPGPFCSDSCRLGASARHSAALQWSSAAETLMQAAEVSVYKRAARISEVQGAVHCMHLDIINVEVRATPVGRVCVDVTLRPNAMEMAEAAWLQNRIGQNLLEILPVGLDFAVQVRQGRV